MRDKLHPPQLRPCLAALIVLLSTITGLGFGQNGHRIVGQIAENHLSPSAKQGVRKLLQGESLAQASTWADEIRSDSAWDHAKVWHYITVEDNQSVAEAVKQGAQNDRLENVYEALQHFEKVLRHPAETHENKVVALKFIVHLVGDIHQPLHVGRGADRGGNAIQVEWFGKRTNLHSLWDEGLIENQGLSFTEWARFLDRVPSAKIKAWQGATMMEWMKESMELRPKVYDFGAGSSEIPKLEYKYAYQHSPTVRLRLQQAGIRLAGLLNSIFK